MLSMKTIAMMCAEVTDNLGDTRKLPEVMYGILRALKDAGEISESQEWRFKVLVSEDRSNTAGIASIIDNNPSWEK